MKHRDEEITLKFASTTRSCCVGEKIGQRGMEQGKIPVLSCEGACIRGEIARLAANMVAKTETCGRACHGELITAPDSAIARWVRGSDRVVLIDGCFMRCHGRILDQMLDADRLVQFDALAVHRKYSDAFDADDVPLAERMATARQVADHVLGCLERRETPLAAAPDQRGCGTE